LVVLIGAFTFLKPQKAPENLQQNTGEFTDVLRIEDQPGITGVQRISAAGKNVTINKTDYRRNRSSLSPTPTPLPYPRMSINYSLRRSTLIRNEVAEVNKTFVIATLDIKNYGYTYFDAHPTRFRLVYRYGEFEPIVTINTGNMLEEVIPNNSRVKGDLVFLLDTKIARSEKPTIRHIDSGYTLLYNLENRRRRW
jgi:hypothetical protein